MIYGTKDYEDEAKYKHGFNIDQVAKELEKRINDFIKDKKVIDIKYQANVISYANESFHGSDLIERALVMYKEHENE